MKSHYDEYQTELEETVMERTKELQDYKLHLEELVEEQTKDIVYGRYNSSMFGCNIPNRF